MRISIVPPLKVLPPGPGFLGSYNLEFLRIEMSGLEPKPIYLYTPKAGNPLIFIRADGTWIRCADQYETDMGSVPALLDGIASPLASPRGFPFHDSAFENHGWWESTDKGKTWIFVLKTEQDVNDALYEWCRADQVDVIESQEIEWGVQLGGTALWNGHTGPFPIDPAPEGTMP